MFIFSAPLLSSAHPMRTDIKAPSIRFPLLNEARNGIPLASPLALPCRMETRGARSPEEPMVTANPRDELALIWGSLALHNRTTKANRIRAELTSSSVPWSVITDIVGYIEVVLNAEAPCPSQPTLSPHRKSPMTEIPKLPFLIAFPPLGKL